MIVIENGHIVQGNRRAMSLGEAARMAVDFVRGTEAAFNRLIDRFIAAGWIEVRPPCMILEGHHRLRAYQALFDKYNRDAGGNLHPFDEVYDDLSRF